MNVLYVTDKGQTNEAPAITRISSTGVEGAIFGNIAAVFMTSRNEVYNKASFGTSGEGSLSYYVSGLSAGEWTITVNGTGYGSAIVTEEGGLLTFTAPAGAVSLAKK